MHNYSWDLDAANLLVYRMEKRKIPLEENSINFKKKRLIITFQQKFDVTEWYGYDHSNTKIGWCWNA